MAPSKTPSSDQAMYSRRNAALRLAAKGRRYRECIPTLGTGLAANG